MSAYKILRLYNNNAILVQDISNHNEAVLVGKGIGYGRRSGNVEYIEDTLVEKQYTRYDDKLMKDYIHLLETLDPEILHVCSNIVIRAQERLGTLNSRTHIVLTDHIGFALERIQMGHEIANPFLEEIKLLYPDEYEIAREARDMLAEEINVIIREDEVGFIALHLHAARQQKDIKEALRYTRAIAEMVVILETEIGKPLPRDLTYSRMAHHLRGMLERCISGRHIGNPLLDTLKSDMKASFEIALKLKGYMEQHFDVAVSEDEVGYMAIHVERIRSLLEVDAQSFPTS